MIENSVSTMIRSAESIGGGLFPEGIAKRRRQVKEAKAKPRYCENPDCRILKLTGERQRLSAYNYIVVDKGAYIGREWSKFCSQCTRSSEVVVEAVVQTTDKRCNRGHDLTRVGAYSDGRCKKCKVQGPRLPRMSHRDGYTDLHGLEAAKNRWGGTFPQLGALVGYNDSTIKSWAYLTSAAPPEAITKLAAVLGCTEAELEGRALEEAS